MARPRTFDESEALEKAVRLFQERGFEKTSIPDLVERLGVCRQSLYNAFGDKRSLYLASLRRWGEREVDSKLALLEGCGPPLDLLRTLVRGWAALATQCPSVGCLTVASIVDNHDDAEALAIVEQQVERTEAGFRRTLERAAKLGQLKADANPAGLASTLTSTYFGLGLLSRLPKSGPRIGDSVASMLRLIDAAAA
jgi:TetR/AcrR family transcriptional regulator, transcriptional repressor for nem operon